MKSGNCRFLFKAARFLNLFLILFANQVLAVEFSIYSGAMIHTNVSGCCQSSGAEPGFGLMGRFQLEHIGELDIGAYSDGRWSEGYVLRPYFILGSPRRFDVHAGESVEVRTVSDLRWIASSGILYFSHTTKKYKFDLPVLVTGLGLTTHQQILYALNDQWDIGGTFQATYAVSRSDQSILFGTFLLLNYFFK